MHEQARTEEKKKFGYALYIDEAKQVTIDR